MGKGKIEMAGFNSNEPFGRAVLVVATAVEVRIDIWLTRGMRNLDSPHVVLVDTLSA